MIKLNVFEVWFPSDERESRIHKIFTQKNDAMRYSLRADGWYGTIGSVHEKTIEICENWEDATGEKEIARRARVKKEAMAKLTKEEIEVLFPEMNQ